MGVAPGKGDGLRGGDMELHPERSTAVEPTPSTSPHETPAPTTSDGVVIQATPPTGNAPLFVKFRALPTDPMGKIVRYQWDFGDGATSDEAEPTHTYSAPDNYQVTLEADVDLSDLVLGLVEPATATQTVRAQDTSWNRSEYRLNLGEGWTSWVDGFSCVDGQHCGTSRVTLPGAPNGIYDLHMRLYLHPNHRGDPHPRFLFNGALVDRVPPKEASGELSFEKVATIRVTSHEYTFEVDDLLDGGVSIRQIFIKENKDFVNSEVSLAASVDRGELPLKVSFGTQSGVRLVDYAWDFGDGGTSTEASPTHVFRKMGRHRVSLAYVDANGLSGLAVMPVTVKPSKVDLPGLKDLRRFGFYSAGFKSLDAAQFNSRRIEELKSMNVNVVTPGGASSGIGGEAQAFRDHAHAHGLEIGTGFLGKGDWYLGAAEGLPRDQWVFDITSAENKLQATDRDGDGVSELDGLVDWFYLGHEMGEYATRDEVRQMNRIVKRYFPTTMTMAYYGNISIGFERAGMHPAGGLREDYRFGDGIADAIYFSCQGPFTVDSSGKRRLDPNATLRSLIKNKQHADGESPGTLVWVNTNLPGEKSHHTEEDMWSAEELLDYVRILLSVGDIDAVTFRAYGRFRYDLAYGMNTSDPSQPVTGFVEQRMAIKTIGGWVKQSRAGRPILIIRSPEIGDHISGTLHVDYAVIGEGTQNVARVAFDVDGGSLVRLTDRQGRHEISGLAQGSHVLSGHLEAPDGTLIEGSDVTVWFDVQP